MRMLSRIAVSSAVVVGLAGTARGDLSGDLVLRVRNPDAPEIVQKGKIYIDGDALTSRVSRVELDAAGDGDPIIFITRGPQDVGYMLLPEEEKYVRMELDGAGAPAPRAPGEGIRLEDLSVIGADRVSGHETTLKAAPLRDDSGNIIGTALVYFADDLDGAPIRSRTEMRNGTVTETSIENPSSRNLPASLFQPPKSWEEAELPMVRDLFPDEDEQEPPPQPAM